MKTLEASPYYRPANVSWCSAAVSSARIHGIEEPTDEPLPYALPSAHVRIVVLGPTVLAQPRFGRLGETSSLLTNLGEAVGEVRYDAIDLHGLISVSDLRAEWLEMRLVTCMPKATHRITAKVSSRQGRLCFVTPSSLEEVEQRA